MQPRLRASPKLAPLLARHEAGTAHSAAARSERARLIDEAARTGAHLVSETMRPSTRGRRYRKARTGIRMIDGPFVETKELLAGYIIVSVNSLDAADRLAPAYIATVEADEVDVRELE